MAFLLLAVIYIAFIGLGVPDSLIGTAWPAVYREFMVSPSLVSCITLLISGCTVLSSMFSSGLLNRFGTAKVTAVSTAMTALSLLGFSFAGNIWIMCLWAIPLGLGAGAIDAGLNNYIALHYKASHMNFLHCFYGIGVSCSPYLMSLALSGSSWRSGYRYAFILQLSITLILILSLPLWKKQSAVSAEGEAEEESGRVLPFREMRAIPEVRVTWALLLATNAIEYVCGVWGSTYLVNAKGFPADSAAKLLTLYYAGMALGRFSSGVLSAKCSTWKRIWIGAVGVCAAVALLVLPLPALFTAVGFFLVGFGNGPIYPNLIYLTPYHFGRDVSQSMMGSQIAAAYIGVMMTPPIFGLVQNLFGMESFPIFLLVLLVSMVWCLLLLAKKLKKNGYYRNDV